MAFVTIIGVNVADNLIYQIYRDNMLPILENFGGEFGYDLLVGKVLKSETKAPMNRVFTIKFPDEKLKNSFFSNKAYLKVREKYFDKSVTDITIIATYES